MIPVISSGLKFILYNLCKLIRKTLHTARTASQRAHDRSGKLFFQRIQPELHAVVDPRVAVLHDDAAQNAAVNALRDPDDLVQLFRKRRPQTFLLLRRECDRRCDRHILGILIIEHPRIECICDLAEIRQSAVVDQQKEQPAGKPLITEDLLCDPDPLGNGERRELEQSGLVRIQR